MSDRTRVLEFIVADNAYCITLDRVGEVIAPGELGSAPNLPADAIGIMDYRNTEILEVWDAATLLRHEETATLQRQREINADIADQFSTIEATLETYLSDGLITDEDAVEQLTSNLASLREDIVAAYADVTEAVVNNRKLIVLDSSCTRDDRRVGLLVDRVSDVRIVTREELDETISGEGVYGAFHNTIVEDESNEDSGTDDDPAEDEETQEQDEQTQADLTIWIDPQTVLTHAPTN